jgi:hypothetical protein
VRTSLFLTCVIASLSFACSSSSSTGTVDGGTDTSSSGSDTNNGGTDTNGGSDTHGGSDTTSGTDTGSGGETGPTDPDCAAKTTNADCQKCCSTNHDTAYQAFVTTLHDCACAAGVCDTACGATFCAATPTNPDATCNTCLGTAQTGACKSALDAACNTPSGACYPFAQCVSTSDCNTKG